MRTRVVLSSLTVVVLLAVGTAACGSDGDSKSQQDVVCDDAGTLKASIEQLVDDVTSGNFGDASDQLSTVRDDFQSLESSVRKLASEKKSSVQSDLDAVQGTLGDLTSATSLDEIQTTLSKARSQMRTAVNSLTKTLSC